MTQVQRISRKQLNIKKDNIKQEDNINLYTFFDWKCEIFILN